MRTNKPVQSKTKRPKPNLHGPNSPTPKENILIVEDGEVVSVKPNSEDTTDEQHSKEKEAAYAKE